ncbi:type 2 isopentenyl-diphosphate Delta-isomerase [Devosia sp.]|uniref:type 2 isopentenyl-diphosphate Delta-isomerase n=1 Tax=Devosia sp. TaxID=1871048 RepID=UPI003A91BB41
MISDRKNQHLDIVLSGKAQSNAVTTGLEHIVFEHCALPELDLDAIDLSQPFVGKRLEAPLLVSSMTGGPARAEAINRNLAAACAELGIALGVGSQRIAIEGDGADGFSSDLRKVAPDIVLLGNFGAAQLNTGFGLDQARRAVEMIGADALIIHLNPLQEAVQPEGDRDWRGLLDKIGALAQGLDVPVVAKEVGGGISAKVAGALLERGVAVIDVAGAGGTSWAAVEAERIADPMQAELARSFTNWGIPTGAAIAAVRAAHPEAVIVGSGGIRSGLDVAKAIRVGADVVGQAAGVLSASVDSVEAVVAHFSLVIAQLRIACFCTGSKDLAALKQAPLVAIGR